MAAVDRPAAAKGGAEDVAHVAVSGRIAIAEWVAELDRAGVGDHHGPLDARSPADGEHGHRRRRPDLAPEDAVQAPGDRRAGLRCAGVWRLEALGAGGVGDHGRQPQEVVEEVPRHPDAIVDEQRPVELGVR